MSEPSAGGGIRPPSNEIEHPDEEDFEVKTLISESAEAKRQAELIRREQAAQAEIERLKEKRQIAAGTPPRGAPPAKVRNPLDRPPRARSGPPPIPVDEFATQGTPASPRHAATPPAGRIAASPFDASELGDPFASSARPQPAVATKPRASGAPAKHIGFEEELFSTEISQLIADVNDIGTAPVEAAISFTPTDRQKRPTGAASERAAMVRKPPIAGATIKRSRGGLIVWFLLLLAMGAGACAVWYYGLVDTLIDALL